MPVRIYAFAKELGLDNKSLLDICEKANIKGKGSALASLDDDEVATIRQFLEKDDVVSEPEPAEPTAPVRPRQTKTKKIEEIVAPKRPQSVETESDPVVDQEPDETESEVVEPAETVAAADESAEPVTQDEPEIERPTKPNEITGGGLHGRVKGGVSKPVRTLKKDTDEPGRPMSPRRPSGPRKLRDLDQPKAGSGKSQDKSKKKPAAAIRVAAMPNVEQPKVKSTEPEVKVQKPDIALPQDAIKSVKAGGGAAPLEHLTKSKSKSKRKGKGDDESEILGDMPGRKPSSTRRRSMVDEGMGTRPNRRRTGGGGARRPSPYRRRRSRSGPSVNTAAPRKDSVVLQLPCTVREVSEAAGVPAVQALLTIKQLGDESRKTINSVLEDEMVELLIEHFDASVELREQQSLEDEILAQFDFEEEDPEKLQPRPPIVTFLGHVDHGKTSLLDALIGIDVVSGEAGGITQHIRAYQIAKGEQRIAFVDTPGHEAFTEMRARGANVTDIAVLVVAADDGIMPQTEEAISHAKAAGVPIVVALNKIDLPGVTADKAMQDLATHELLPSEWGGDTEVIKTSATQGTGLDDLLETILVTAELHEYTANPERPAFGTCLEAEQQSDRGVVAKLLVQSGTLNVGDVIVCGPAYGKVKAMHDTLHPKKKLQSAGPSTPINLTGLDEAPGAGDKFFVVDDVAKARELAEQRKHEGRVEMVGGRTVETSLERFQELLESGSLAQATDEVVTLNLIIRADVKGSIEAIQKELGKITHPEVEIKVLQALAGGVSVGDVRLAQASNAVIVGFNVVANEEARSLAEETGVEIRRYDVIYKITDDLKATLEGRLKPEEQVVESGMAMILRTFNIAKSGTIAGCRVMRGTVQRDCRMRVIRDQTVIGDYPIESLKREKDDVKEVQRGMECGIKLEKFNDVKEGDTLEAYRIEEIARTL